jgi:hypothetical protein
VLQFARTASHRQTEKSRVCRRPQDVRLVVVGAGRKNALSLVLSRRPFSCCRPRLRRAGELSSAARRGACSAFRVAWIRCAAKVCCTTAAGFVHLASSPALAFLAWYASCGARGSRPRFQRTLPSARARHHICGLGFPSTRARGVLLPPVLGALLPPVLGAARSKRLLAWTPNPKCCGLLVDAARAPLQLAKLPQHGGAKCREPGRLQGRVLILR